MIIKKILCQVKNDELDAFSKLQAHWQSISTISGFLGQVGGWDIKHKYTAHIFSFWENKNAYDYFMKNVHDSIFINSNQLRTYTAIDVELFEEIHRIQGMEKDIISILGKSMFIRTALCEVKEGRTAHFKEMQRKVWNLGMNNTQNMLGGEFGVSIKDYNRLLVLTGWISEEAHEDYVRSHFPDLKRKARTDTDLKEIVGGQFIIEDSWRVIPKR